MNRILAVLPLILMLVGCNQAPQAVDPSVITSRSDAWEAALNAKDIDALVALYTSDARIMPPNGKMSSGSEAVRAQFGAMIDSGIGGELTSVEAMVAGDIGFNVGVYTLQAGGEVVDTGKYMETWRRGDDGQWRIANDIWNSDNAPAPMHHGPKMHVMIMHEVEDAGVWRAAWRGEDSRHRLFADNGAAHVHVLQSADNENLTGLVVAVKDMEAFNAMLGSSEGMAAAAEDGVKADTMRVLVEIDP